MSFSLQFIARDKAHARQLVERASGLPSSVRTFLNTAIDSLRSATEEHPRVISVKANGHLCESGNDYSVSSATIEVTPLSIS